MNVCYGWGAHMKQEKKYHFFSMIKQTTLAAEETLKGSSSANSSEHNQKAPSIGFYDRGCLLYMSLIFLLCDAFFPFESLKILFLLLVEALQLIVIS